MTQSEFAILHTLPAYGQVLIVGDYDHDKEQFLIKVRFWHDGANGYAEINLRYDDDKETVFDGMFAAFKSVDFTQDWVDKLL